jgi:hypothetical protein
MYGLLNPVIHCYAQNAVPDQETAKKIIGATKSYIAAISCETGNVTAEDIATLTPFKIIDFEYTPDAKYAVLWSGDIGCAGGSGAIQTNIAIVTTGRHGEFLVDPNLSSPIVKFEWIVSRNFPKIIGNTHDSIALDGLDYAGNDGMCCPSLPVRVTVRVDEKGNWKVVERIVERK